MKRGKLKKEKPFLIFQDKLLNSLESDIGNPKIRN